MTGAAALPALSLYRGKVMHARLKPVGHRFSYSVASILIDIDRLEEADRSSVFFSVNRRNLVAFHEKHHGPRDGSPLRPYVDALMAEAGLARAERVLLLCYPTVAGHTFNPLSVYFCYDAAGSVAALLYQVHNTFGQSHTYVHPVLEGQSSPAGIRQEQRKEFYVSPFLDPGLLYRFRIRPPDDEVALRILEMQGEDPVLAASFHGNWMPARGPQLLRSVLQTFGIPWKVTAGIHFEALRLWLKGVRLRERPQAPAQAHSIGSAARARGAK